MKPFLRERGAALLTAMIIVALVATLASSMLWQQHRAIQVEAAERARAQSAWVLSGALDWARLILREDAKGSTIDHLGEPWAVPLAESRLSTFLAADKDNTDDAPDAFLSGSITDATGRFNLKNVVTPQGAADPIGVAGLQRLCESLGLSVEVANRIATGMRDSTPRTASAGASAPGAAGTAGPTGVATAVSTAPVDPPLAPIWASQLNWFGIDPESLRLLEPYVVILPEQTQVNVNTASREVIAAALGIDVATAERIVQARQRNPLKSAEDIKAIAPVLASDSADAKANLTRASWASSWFEVRGRLRLDEVVLEQRSLVHRRSPSAIDVVQRERVSARDPAGS